MVFIRIILGLVYIFLAFNVLYILLFAIAGRLRRSKKYAPADFKNKIAVLIPAYKEDNVIKNTSRQAVKHDYPNDSFDVFVIADKLAPETIDELSKMPLEVIPVNFEKSTKAHSLRYTMQKLPEDKYSIVVILDSDNIMENGCLEKVNAAFEKGFRMVQLHRFAKNMNTPIAVLDAISEEINNHIFRKGHRALGISSAPIGSGIAFDFKEYKSLLMATDKADYGGHDRESYLRMLRRGFVCEYIDDAIVLDEKVQNSQVLEKQRQRWISAQLRYAREFWFKNPSKTFSFGIHYFDFAVQTLIFPRVLLLFFLGFIFVLAWGITAFAGSDLFPGTISWSILFLVYLLALFISMGKKIPVKTIISASFKLPAIFLSVLKALLKSRPSQKGFVRTPKEYIEETEESKI